MDKNKAHDIVHMWNGGKAENCPVCNGQMTGEEDLMTAARAIAEEQYYPRMNPNLPMDKTMYMSEDDKPTSQVDTEEDKPPSQQPPDTQEPTSVSPDNTPKTMSETNTPSFMTDILSFSEDSQKLPLRIKIIPTGTFKTQAYGDVKISRSDLLEMADNFKKGVRAGVPIDIDHDQKAAAGWINDVEVSDDGMYADVEWTKLGEDKLSTKEYRFFSPEFAQSYIDPEHSHELSNVLIAGSLVNRPMFKELPAIAGSEEGVQENLTKNQAPLMLFISNTKDTQNNAEIVANDQSESLLKDTVKEKPMDLQAILAKEKSVRTSEEQVFVAQNLDQLTDEQKVAEGFVVTASEEKKEEAPTDTPPAPEPSQTTTVTASENGGVVISAAELKALEDKANQGALAFSELQKSQEKLQRIEITEKVKSFTFSEKGGKIAPAQVEPVVNLMMAMSEPQRAEMTKILEALPDRKVFGEMGSDEDLDKSKAADILTAKANELVRTSKESGSTMTFSDALKQVSNQNPELYMESLKGANAN